MSQGEAALAASILRTRGYDVDGPGPDTGTVIIFTCDVIEATENRMWKRISSAHTSGRRLVVAGCLGAISDGEIIKRFPGTEVIDTMGIGPLRSSIESLFPMIGPMGVSEHPVERVHHIVPISSGCFGHCTYCKTREARGPMTSNPPDRIVSEVRRGVLRGRKEVLLTSQDSAAYGLDGIGAELPELLKAVTDYIEGDHMIRVGMMNPENVLPRLDRILDSYRSDRIFKFFHIPLQSGSDRILSMMGRGYSVAQFFRIVDAIRVRYPWATISTDMIVGFPGEDSYDHRASLDAVERMRPDILNVTRFSPRIGTPAAVMKGRILQRAVKERSREMVSAHSAILRGILSGRLENRYCPVLVTEIGKRGTMMGRDINYTPVVVKGGPELLGLWIEVERLSIGTTYIVARPLVRDIHA
jgi:threonylcarbamoyladenosine tRNA methylthiotransferase CDKAL1